MYVIEQSGDTIQKIKKAGIAPRLLYFGFKGRRKLLFDQLAPCDKAKTYNARSKQQNRTRFRYVCYLTQ